MLQLVTIAWLNIDAIPSVRFVLVLAIGFDPDSCNRVLVEHCIADVGDNSVAVKSGMDKSGRAFARPAANTVFRDSQFVCETFAIGSEMSGDVVNMTVSRCKFGGQGSDFAGIHLKSQRGRGGTIANLVFEDLDIDLSTSTKQPFAVSANMAYSGNVPPTNKSATPTMRNVTVQRVAVHLPDTPGYSKGVFDFEGLPDSLLQDFTFKDVTVVSGATTATGDEAWKCVNATGFEFAGNVTPHPGPMCAGKTNAQAEDKEASQTVNISNTEPRQDVLGELMDVHDGNIVQLRDTKTNRT